MTTTQWREKVHLRGGLVLLAACSFLALGLPARPAAAQQSIGSTPLVIVNVASINRVLNDINYMYEVAERPDAVAQVERVLSERGDLRGINRDEPLGMMLFWDGSIPPSPTMVFYFGIDDEYDLLDTVGQTGPWAPEAVEGRESRYRLQRTGALPQRISPEMQINDGFAFISQDPAILDRPLPNPRELTRGMIDRYDVSASIQMDGVPQLLRDLFTGLLRNSGQARLQRRDGESEQNYAFRRAGGEWLLGTLVDVLQGGRQAMIGWDVSRESRRGALELTIDAKPGTDFDKYLQSFAARPSYFAPVFDEDLPMAAAIRWNLHERDRTLLTAVITAWEELMSTRPMPNEDMRFEEMGLPEIARSLRATFERGEVDGFWQVRGNRQNGLMWMGGMQIAGENTFAAGLERLMQTAQNETERQLERRQNAQAPQDPLSGDDDNPPEFDAADFQPEFSTENYQNIVFQRVADPPMIQQQMEARFGGEAATYFGAGRRSMWWARGSDRTLQELQDVIDSVLIGSTRPNRTSRGLAGEALIHAYQLEPFTGLSEGTRQHQIFTDAFADGQDTIHVEFGRTGDGIRLKIHAEEGFVRVMGTLMADRPLGVRVGAATGQ